MKEYLFIILLLIFIPASIHSTAIVSPFDYSTIYAPAGMYRMSYSATLTTSPSVFTVPFSSSFTSVPIVLYSISSLTFSKGIKYKLSITNTTSSAVTANFIYDSTVTKAAFLFFAMDSTLYSATFSSFTYTMPVGTNTPQTINIIGAQQYDANYLVGMQATIGPFPSGYAPQVDSYVLVDTSNIISANLSFAFDPSQLSINSITIYFVDFNISSFKARPYAGKGQQFAIYGTNGLATDTTQTETYIYSYANSYFTGLQTIYDGQFLFNSLSFDIVAMLNTNVYYFISQLLFVSYKCPGNFPYITSARTLCYSDCQIGFYADSQYICQPCYPNCYTCFNKPTNCTSCVSPYVLVYGYVCACGQDSYETLNVNGTLQCILCSTEISGCKKCTSSTDCILCMNNLNLDTPVNCSCPNVTALMTIGTNMICVQITSILVPITQSCPPGMLTNYSTCTCPSDFNLTFINGICS